MVINKYKDKKIDDQVFIFSKKAKEKKEEIGKENTINGTLGIFYNEDEELHILDSVYTEYKNLNSFDIFGYASSIDGDEKFKEAVKICTLGKNYKNTYKNNFTEVIATPGGTGAIYNTFQNYLNDGEKVLLPEFMWGSYKVIAKECGGNYETYKMFNKENNFNLETFKDSVLSLAKVQRSLVIVINDPCHNPTGYKLSKKEWTKIIDILKIASECTNVVLLRDIAYSDFDETPIDINDLFISLPKNFLVILAFSISKSFSSYGLRVGAQVAITSCEKIQEEFLNANKHTGRGVWSNISKSGMTMFSNLVLNKNNTLLKEREYMITLLKERADIFINTAKNINLDILPYESGFFLFIPLQTTNYNIISKKLEDENIYITGSDLGIRIALCSIPKNKIKLMAEKIKKYL
ncbi:aminotransferase class I/II-fold pyridoxal phosphate-dependent enzyme [uncultured Cetobacterium sp.]|uniref:pyridoxal phosphate-dependent aminotransferase n=1 Tax=uncultured Cetobacterium sp. TaxID=527638 RepID=UPI0026251978|nr:aminotransferase class I/II-fold pyridoxal phosphate-dependent enzyme [uncultured Cetobacterium sp.]